MCLFLKIHVLNILFEKWFWELNMLIGSLVELHVRLHSCLCFSHLEKLLLKVGSRPPRYLVIYRASLAFSNRNLDSFSIPGGSIENGSASSIASRHLVDWTSFCSWFWWVVPRYLLDTSTVDKHFLDTSSTDTSIPTSVEIYWLSYLSFLCNPVLISFDLSLDTSLFSLLKLSHLTPNFVPQGFFKLFQVFLYLVSF